MSSSMVVYEGWMVRYGRRKIGSSFIHMRYFVLETQMLCYYKQKNKMGSEFRIKSLHINGNCRVEDRGLKMHQGHMMYVLCVYNKMEKDNLITMAAFNIQEALIWKEKIEMVIDQQQGVVPADSNRGFYSPQQQTSLENGRKSSSSDHESQSSLEEEEEEGNQRSLPRRTTIGNEMDDQENEHEALERILIDASVEPVMLSYAFLKIITKNFSQVIGSGGFGVVYMGALRNGKVAVKKLSKADDFSEKQFEDELICLIRVNHKNIVRLLGYCSDTSRQVVQYNGKYVLADVRQRFLCFEYVPNKSLHDYLKDKSHGCDWDTRYHLIEGICQGLRYLHNEEHINHLDLKPENILLDVDMVPKITDFGLSRRFSGEQSRIITENIRGTPGYIAPEYWNRGEISFKADIFSLGIIIIKLLRGSNDLFDLENWHKSLVIDCPQGKRCIKIAQLCVEDDQRKRPTIDYIIDMLSEKERNNSGSSLEEVLGIRDLIPARFRELWLFRR